MKNKRIGEDIGNGREAYIQGIRAAKSHLTIRIYIMPG